MKNREKRAKIAKETLEIIDKGFYINSKGEEIKLKEATQQSIEHTVHYKPQDFDADFEKEVESIIEERKNKTETIFEINNETTLSAASRAKLDNDKVLCLNFASAKNPGGGFLVGSQAQEESLARASNLYLSLINKMAMYEFHRGRKDCLYSDNMIFSPEITVFRNDNDELLDEPYQVSLITSPAVNAGCIRQKYNKQLSQIEPKMISRIEKVLALALSQKVETLVLGAWGCGVFGNDPEKIASYFAQFLKTDGRFENVFTKIIFAVLDNSKSEQFIKPFKKYFD